MTSIGSPIETGVSPRPSTRTGVDVLGAVAGGVASDTVDGGGGVGVVSETVDGANVAAGLIFGTYSRPCEWYARFGFKF